jgi:transcriptional regulator with XRE-family HTH domain
MRVTVRVVDPVPLAAVLGENCKAIRTAAEVTQDELARYARRFGLRWTASKVRDFEVGRTAPTFATVLALSAALDAATAKRTGRAGKNLMEIELENRVRLTDLVISDRFITLTEEFEPLGQVVADYCAGEPWDPLGRFATPKKFDLARMRQASGLTEDRLAARLGITRDELAALSLRLWRKPFSQERDRLAGPGANKQKRGQVSRALRAELEKALADGHD